MLPNFAHFDQYTKNPNNNNKTKHRHYVSNENKVLTHIISLSLRLQGKGNGTIDLSRLNHRLRPLRETKPGKLKWRAIFTVIDEWKSWSFSFQLHMMSSFTPKKGVKYVQYAQTSTRVHVAVPRSKTNLSFPTGNILPRHKGSYLIKIIIHSVPTFTPNWYKYFLICSSVPFSINVLIITPLCIFIFATLEWEYKLFSLVKEKRKIDLILNFYWILLSVRSFAGPLWRYLNCD